MTTQKDDAAECECYGSSLRGITFCPLHAAAPEMLEALQKAADTFHDCVMVLDTIGKPIMAQASRIAEDHTRATIRKATEG